LPPAEDDDPPRWAWIEAERQADLPRRPGVEPIHDRQRWLAQAARRAHAQHGAEVATWHEDGRPPLTDEVIAATIAHFCRTDQPETTAEQAARIRAQRGA